MNKLKMKNLKTSGMLMVAVFGFSIILPSVASAKFSVGGSLDECISNLSSEKLATIKTYGQKRVDSRNRALDRIDSKLKSKADANSKRYDEKLPSVQKFFNNPDGATGKKGAEDYRQQIIKKFNATANPAYAAPAIPTKKTDVATLGAQYNNAKEKVSTANTAIANSNSKAYVVSSICKAVHEGQVFFTVMPSAKRAYLQARIDNLYLLNSVTVERFNVAREVYDIKKAADPDFDKDNALKTEIGKVADPNGINNDLAGYEATMNAQIADPKFKVDGLNTSINGTKTAVAARYKEVNTVYKKALGLKSKAPRSSSNNGTGGASPNTDSSPSPRYEAPGVLR